VTCFSWLEQRVVFSLYHKVQPVDDAVADPAARDLSAELERLERLVGLSSTSSRWVDPAGRHRFTVSDELLALVERQHTITQRLRRSRP